MSVNSSPRRTRALLLTASLFLLPHPTLSAQDELPPVVAVDHVDLERYAGTWYEIARFPNKFQDKCVAETTATYELLDNGQITVINRCRLADGSVDTAQGRAKLADEDGPTSKLKVRFAPRILSWLPSVWGDYWVLDITDDYSAVLVGEPRREYLWILARTAEISENVYNRLVASAAAQGFAVGNLRRYP
jgi:apolipoprotein D and lipocalin family protein